MILIDCRAEVLTGFSNRPSYRLSDGRLKKRHAQLLLRPVVLSFSVQSFAEVVGQPAEAAE